MNTELERGVDYQIIRFPSCAHNRHNHKNMDNNEIVKENEFWVLFSNIGFYYKLSVYKISDNGCV